ncbi:putative 1-acyl-sn-glycerol-3-phosphate acyltransferase family protein [Lyophyllum shimeji]|uniref:1-acyl-sn-glycerol-3-phosphate acyltransferase n=1 Tax=Lyophyllum shimeji TaxID=47721 RepID=A0A9P3PEW1_LYOSH|nr:putative 1-acyl-sn-glycerol-3-phosphate acyltransferase family protein [Lyophyllum shimeji]
MAFLVSLVKPLAYLSLPVILLRSIAATSSTGRYYVRQGVYVGTLMTLAACSVVVAAGMSIVGKQFDVNYVVARTFYAVARRVLQVEIEVEGEEHLDGRPGVLMANHQTMLDIIVVGRLMPKQTSIMAKKSLQYTPLGPFMTMSGAIFIDRANNAAAVQSLIAAGDLMRARKLSLWIFPEGTRTSKEEPYMRPLKKGGFHLAIQSGLPIIPIVTENYWRLYHKGVFNTGTIKVRVLPPIATTGLTAADIPALTERVRDQMLETLREISVPPSKRSTPESEEKTEKSHSEAPAPASSSSGDASPDTGSQEPSPVIPSSLGTGLSSSSLASSASASNLSKSEISERGAETEEDEGMILVGRPT